MTPCVQGFSEPEPWPLRDGDRIVLVGDTLVERDQRYGYLETCLTLLNPELNLTFRNLGWSGDTVAGLSRAGFDPPEAGFKALVEQVKAAKPTVLIVGYGMADSFDGEAGLSRFEAGFNRLLGAIAPAPGRLLLLSPIPHERLGPPLPDPAPHNRDLVRYSDVIRRLAEARADSLYVSQLDSFRPSDPAWHYTDDGIHLTPASYREFGMLVAQRLGLFRRAGFGWDLALGPDGQPRRRFNVEVLERKEVPGGYRLVLRDRYLPIPSPPVEIPDGPHFARDRSPNFRVEELPAGTYLLRIDGKVAFRGDPKALAKGIRLDRAADFERVEKLRETINAKNELFFHRWRPQNQTYLFGFRKHEQGNNAVEIPRFDPLVAAKEKEIAELKKPVSHVYEIVREGEVAR